MRTNTELNEYLNASESSGIDALYLVKYVTDKRRNKKKSFYQPLDLKLQNSLECVSMYSKYISTQLGVNCNSLREAIENKSYIPNECWINTIMDFYNDTVLSQAKSTRHRVTREKMLELLNVSEDTLKMV